MFNFIFNVSCKTSLSRIFYCSIKIITLISFQSYSFVISELILWIRSISFCCCFFFKGKILGFKKKTW